ncbi:MAG: ribosomal RNA small subunit methyltransferase A [Anaerolineales bacterium]|nr:ribosomal RNA small subunit methyltransferase A [Anaerolineales bacterium]
MQSLHLPSLLRRFNLQPKKSLGQNFLVEERALEKVVEAAELTPHDTVLEIGPGLGSLTRHLAQSAARVVAVELDQNLLEPLSYVLEGYESVELIHGDILALPPSSFNLPPSYKVVANIPYYITSAVIRHLLEAENQPSRVVLTIQKEVAERVCAAPPDMNLLAVSVQFYSVPKVVAKISAGAFYPRPEVDSAVVRLDVRSQSAVPVPSADEFFRVVKAGFGQKRKQVRNSLSAGLSLPAELVEAWLTRANIDPKRRAETLSLEEWGSLTQIANQR